MGRVVEELGPVVERLLWPLSPEDRDRQLWSARTNAADGLPPDPPTLGRVVVVHDGEVEATVTSDRSTWREQRVIHAEGDVPQLLVGDAVSPPDVDEPPRHTDLGSPAAERRSLDVLCEHPRSLDQHGGEALFRSCPVGEDHVADRQPRVVDGVDHVVLYALVEVEPVQLGQIGDPPRPCWTVEEVHLVPQADQPVRELVHHDHAAGAVV